MVRDLRAHGKSKERTIEISANEVYKNTESRDVLMVWPHARFSGWKNTVKKVMVRCVVEQFVVCTSNFSFVVAFV